MKKKSIGALVAGAALALGMALSGAPAANAATSDCPAPSMCYWNGGTFPGIPYGYTLGTPSHNQYANVDDNIISSGINKRAFNGLDRWCGLNQLNVAVSETVARFNYNVALSLQGGPGDNKIDDLLYSNC